MATAEATEARSFSGKVSDLAETLVGLTLLEAQELADCLEEKYGIKPAGGGVMMAAAPAGDSGGPAAAVEQTEFDVVLTGFGDAKINVIKAIRSITGLGLKEAKELVEGAPKPVKQGVSKEDAEKVKKEITDAGGTAEIK
jgi:large subunit ribosomal protein L7/L12